MFRQFKKGQYQCNLFNNQLIETRPLTERNNQNSKPSKISLKTHSHSQKKHFKHNIHHKLDFENKQSIKQTKNPLNYQRTADHKPFMVIRRPGTHDENVKQKVQLKPKPQMMAIPVQQSSFQHYHADRQIFKHVSNKIPQKIIFNFRPPLNPLIYHSILLQSQEKIPAFSHRYLKSEHTTLAGSIKDPINFSLLQSNQHIKASYIEKVNVQTQTESIQTQFKQSSRKVAERTEPRQITNLFSCQKFQKEIEEKEETESIYEQQSVQYSRVIISCRKLMEDTSGRLQETVQTQLFNYQQRTMDEEVIRSNTFNEITIERSCQV